MRRLLCLLCCTIFSLSAWATPDYAELNKAVEKFFTSLNAVNSEVEAAKSAKDCARLLDAWASANNELGAAAQKFSEANPEIAKQKEAPAELAASYERLKSMGQEYPTMGTTLGVLAKKHSENEQVKEAMERFRTSLAGLQKLGPPQEN